MLRPILFYAFIAAVCFTQNALADNSPSPLGQAEGFLIHSSTSVSNLEFTEGRYSNCIVSTGALEVTRCKLDGAKVTLKSSTGAELDMTFSDLTYYETSFENVLYRTYNYKGIWKMTQNGKTLETSAVVRFNQASDRDPSNLSGYLKIDDLDVTEQIKATLK